MGSVTGNTILWSGGQMGSVTGNTLLWSGGQMGSVTGNTTLWSGGQMGSVTGNTIPRPVFRNRIRMDPDFFADPDPDFSDGIQMFGRSGPF